MAEKRTSVDAYLASLPEDRREDLFAGNTEGWTSELPKLAAYVETLAAAV